MEKTIQQGYFLYHDETTNEWSAGKRYLAQQQIQKQMENNKIEKIDK